MRRLAPTVLAGVIAGFGIMTSARSLYQDITNAATANAPASP